MVQACVAHRLLEVDGEVDIELKTIEPNMCVGRLYGQTRSASLKILTQSDTL